MNDKRVSDKVERRYRRLLALYPRDHRERHGEEMLGVLLDSSPNGRDGLDLVGGAIVLHLRRVVGLDGGVNRRDVMAVVGLLGPIVLLTGAASDLHEIAWWIKAGALADMPYRQVPEAPAWGAWLVVAILTLFGLRRTAAMMAWLASATLLVIMARVHVSYAGDPMNDAWLMLGVLTAISLTWSAGPSRGKELVGRRGILLAIAGVTVSILLMAVTPSLYAVGFWAYELGPWLATGTLALGCYLACRPVSDRRTGRRAAFVLALPVVTAMVVYVLKMIVGPPIFWVPVITDTAFYGIPILMVLAGNGILRPVRKSLPS